MTLRGLDHYLTTDPLADELGSAPQPPTLVETYLDFDIFACGDEAPFFDWEHGDGDTIEAIREQIDDWIRERVFTEGHW